MISRPRSAPLLRYQGVEGLLPFGGLLGVGIELVHRFWLLSLTVTSDLARCSRKENGARRARQPGHGPGVGASAVNPSWSGSALPEAGSCSRC